MVRAAEAAALAAALCFVQAAGAQVPDLERGRGLYENHCQVCHTQSVHTRPNRMTLTAAQLRDIIDNWQKEERLRWSSQDIDDVVFFLGSTRYKF